MNNIKEEYVFWKLLNSLITKAGYRFLKISENQQEIWLESLTHKDAQIVRILRYNLDWSNWLQRDIEHTSMIGENIRKQLSKRSLTIVNIYVSEHLPVDDYEFRIENHFVEPTKKKTSVQSVIVDRLSLSKKLDEIRDIFGNIIEISTIDNVNEEEIMELKQTTLNFFLHKQKQEQQIFQFGKPFFTYLFLAIQIILFLLMEVSGGSTNTGNLIKFGAKYNPLIIEGEWWRFVTPLFLHIGMIHLLMNSLALFYLGQTVEKIYGKTRFLFIYLFAGFMGVMASFLLNTHLSAGASGAIFGCFGALLYFGVVQRELFFRTMGMNLIIVLVINLGLGFTLPGVDNAGHIGGLIGGFLAAGIVYFPKKNRYFSQFTLLTITIILTSGLLYYGFTLNGGKVDDASILSLVQEHIQKEDYEDAYQLLKRHKSEDQRSIEYLLMLSFTELKINKWEDAEEHLKEIIRSHPDTDEAYYYLAHIEIQKGNNKQAINYLKIAIDYNPTENSYHALLDEINK